VRSLLSLQEFVTPLFYEMTRLQGTLE